MRKPQHPKMQQDDGVAPEEPAREPGTWIIRRPRRRSRSPVQRALPLEDAQYRSPTADPDGNVAKLDDLGDAEFRKALLDGDDDIELADLSSVEDDQPMTAEERAGLDRALQALAKALGEAIDEMIPDDEDADDAG